VFPPQISFSSFGSISGRPFEVGSLKPIKGMKKKKEMTRKIELKLVAGVVEKLEVPH